MEYNKTAGGVLLDDADYGFWTYDNKGYPDTAETADVLCKFEISYNTEVNRC